MFCTKILFLHLPALIQTMTAPVMSWLPAGSLCRAHGVGLESYRGLQQGKDWHSKQNRIGHVGPRGPTVRPTVTSTGAYVGPCRPPIAP